VGTTMLRTALVVALLTTAATVVAGDVAGTLGGGTLKLKGSDDGDELIITGVSAGNVTVLPGGDTTLNGSSALQMFTGVTGVKIDVGDGADLVDADGLLLAGGLSFKSGAGADSLTVLNSTIDGATKIDLGSESNVLELCSIDFAKLSIKAGTPTQLGVITADCPQIDFESSTDFGTAAALGDLFIAGTLGVKMGKGADALTLQQATLQSDAKIAMGAHANGVAICEVEVLGNVTIGTGKTVAGSFTSGCLDSGATASGQAGIAVGDLDVGGNLKVKTSASADALDVVEVLVNGKTTVDLGAGENAMRLLSDTLVGNVAAKAGKQADVFAITNVLFESNAKFTLGAGDNGLVGDGSQVNGDLTVKAGKGNDTIDTAGIVVFGTKKVNGGGGMDTIID
jgi:hypothetical protein